jgi:phosphopantothenate---cysteine ligase (CTP)
MNILITSGGTKVKIDRVRHIGNMSTGTFASRIAQEALKAGHDVHFLMAKRSKTPFNMSETVEDIQMYNSYEEYKEKYEVWHYEYFEDYLAQLSLLSKTDDFDAVILAAAVSDYGVDNYVDGKIRSSDEMVIRLKPLPKIIGMCKDWFGKAKLIGFKLLVDSSDIELTDAAKKSIEVNRCDLVVANDLRDIQNNKHKLLLVSRSGIEKCKSDKDNPNYLAWKVIKAVEDL